MPELSSLASQLHGYTQIMLAFSGGLDSTVLLHRLMLLRKLQPELKLRAVHIHHGISPNADNWASHCQTYCALWQISYEVIRVNISHYSGLGTEAAARRARYNALRQIQCSDELLLTGHHLGDQCETFLLALKRGSGPAGLSAMPGLQKKQGRWHCRPLLRESRAQLEKWARVHQLTWIEDESNGDIHYDRNFLRLDIIPALTARWLHFPEMAARSAALCAEQEALLDELLAPQLAACLLSDGGFCSAPLHNMSPIKRYALLRRWLMSQGGAMPSRDGLERLWREVVLSREDASPHLQWGQQVIRRYRQTLYLCPVLEDKLPEQICWPPPYSSLHLPAGLGILALRQEGNIVIRAPYRDERVTLRFAAPGKFAIIGRRGRRTLKKLWQEYGIPPWMRKRTPLLFYNETLIAALGVFITSDGAVVSTACCWQLCWSKHDGERK